MNYAELISTAEKSYVGDLSYYFSNYKVKLNRLANKIHTELDYIINNICVAENEKVYKKHNKYKITLKFNQWDHEDYTTDDIRTILTECNIFNCEIKGYINEDIYTYIILFSL